MDLFLGIDPGLATVGFGVLRREGRSFFHVAHGALKTPASLSAPERLHQIREDMNELLRRFPPLSVGVEKLFFAQNTTTALAVSEARGVLLETVFSARVPLFEMTPLQVKNDICGDGRADKLQVQQMMKRLLNLQKVPYPDDAADALAIALYTARVYHHPQIHHETTLHRSKRQP